MKGPWWKPLLIVAGLLLLLTYLLIRSRSPDLAVQAPVDRSNREASSVKAGELGSAAGSRLAGRGGGASSLGLSRHGGPGRGAVAARGGVSRAGSREPRPRTRRVPRGGKKLGPTRL